MSVQISFNGNAAANPQTRTFENGNTTTSVNVGINQGYYDKSNQWVDQGTMWVNVNLDASQPKSLVTNIHKGTRLIVVGALKQREYTDKNGAQRSALDVRAQYVGLAPKPQTQATGYAPQAQQAAQFASATQANDLWTSSEFGEAEF